MTEKRPVRYDGPVFVHSCGHLSVGGPDNCPLCNDIKIAENKRGKKVLKMACGKIQEIKDKIPENLMSTPTLVALDIAVTDIRKAFQERFPHEG